MGRGLGHAERWRISQLLPDPMPVRGGSLPVAAAPEPTMHGTGGLVADVPRVVSHEARPEPSPRSRWTRPGASTHAHPGSRASRMRAAPSTAVPRRGRLAQSEFGDGPRAHLVEAADEAPALDRTLRGIGVPTASGPGELRGPLALDVDDRDRPRAVLLGFGDEGTAYERDRAGAELWPDPSGRGVWLAWRGSSQATNEDASGIAGHEQPVAVLLSFELAFGLLEELLSLTPSADAEQAAAREQRTTDALSRWQEEAEGW